MTLAEAAADTGLDAGFLEWALNAGLLQGTRDADSSWHLPYDAAPTSPLRDPVDDDIKESGTAGAAVAEDVARLHRQLAGTCVSPRKTGSSRHWGQALRVSERPPLSAWARIARADAIYQVARETKVMLIEVRKGPRHGMNAQDQSHQTRSIV